MEEITPETVEHVEKSEEITTHRNKHPHNKAKSGNKREKQGKFGHWKGWTERDITQNTENTAKPDLKSDRTVT